MFSVVVPVYNHRVFLSEAVSSALRSELVSEVLLLDDGSRDGSPQLAAEWAHTHEKVHDLTPAGGGNRGAHHRLNELVAAARNDWVAVLNSDDAFVAKRFETMAADPRFAYSDFVFGNLLLMNGCGRLVGAKRGPFDTSTPFPTSFDLAAMVEAGDLLDLLSHQNYIGTTSNMVFRKELHARVGGFAPYRYVHDWDFALRAMALGKPLYVRRFLTTYRMHAANTIGESAVKVDLEAHDAFERFAGDFPEIVSRPCFGTGLQTNVNLTAHPVVLQSAPNRASL
jgi:glycosyltransferase involved in cell wall biosynthesis